MGHREAIVRRQLENEARNRAERERELAEEASMKLLEYDELIAAFDHEGVRVATTLSAADWKMGVIKAFPQPKRHWWKRPQLDEFACLHLIRHTEALHIWIRSDDVLFIGDRFGTLHRPRAYFRRVLDASNMEVQLLDFKIQLSKIRSVLQELRNYPGSV